MATSTSFGIGIKFKFNVNDDNSIIYEVDDIITTPITYYKCKRVTDGNEWPINIYLSPDQLNHVTPSTPSQQVDDDDKKQENEEEKEENEDKRPHKTSYRLNDNYSEDVEHLASVLPYFTDWMMRREKSVLTESRDYKNDPSGYLKAIRDKYNIKHRRQFNIDDNDDDTNEYQLRPWIEGKMEKLMGQTGYFGNSKWNTRLFRLFDEALVWFDNDGWFKRRNKDEKEYMTPFGVLPLAMITGLKTADIAAMDVNISEDDLLRLELQIGDEGIIMLKCSDFNQRIKWYECLHTAIFTVERPLFTTDKDLWRISEPKPLKETEQLTKGDLENKNKKRRSIKTMHVRMGQSLAFKLKQSNLFTPSGRTPNNEDIELGDGKKSPYARINEVATLSNAELNAKIL